MYKWATQEHDIGYNSWWKCTAVSPGAAWKQHISSETEPSEQVPPPCSNSKAAHQGKWGRAMISDVLPSHTWPSGAGLHLWEESWLRKQGVSVSRILLLNEAERTVTRGQRVDYIFLHSSRSWFQGCQKWFLICKRGFWPFIHEDSQVILWQAQETETECGNHLLHPQSATPFPHLDPHQGQSLMEWSLFLLFLFLLLFLRNKNLFSAFLLWNNSSLHCIS